MDNKTLLENKLTALKISGTVAAVSDNTFYTCYRIFFNPDITINKIKSRLDDIALFFGAPVELETDAGAVILKVQKGSRDIIGLYDFTCDIEKGLTGYNVPLIIGQKENSEKYYIDLTAAPHILAGGATGSGKSVFMHNLIISTFYGGKVNLLLIDVKRVEFSMYEGIPHLVTSICYDAATAYRALKNLNCEMTRRYELLKNNKCRNIQEYRDRGGRLNYIAVFVDELADLVLQNKRIETELIKIAQLGRAAGIHLILATQRPDATILSGLIRANVPTRVCFAVQKATDSRIILDQTGGEKLRGRGDGIIIPMGSKNPIHFQAPYITTKGIEKAADLARHVND